MFVDQVCWSYQVTGPNSFKHFGHYLAYVGFGSEWMLMYLLAHVYKCHTVHNSELQSSEWQKTTPNPSILCTHIQHVLRLLASNQVLRETKKLKYTVI